MPNSLAHFGGQGPLARLIDARVDAKWILLGCVLPDVPWIARRAVTAVAGGFVDPVALRLYGIVQASLAFSLILAGILALLSARPKPVFGVLTLGALLHLLLDAAQTKWGNGVHFLAPISWEMINFGWFWPESVVTGALTVGGLGYVAWEWLRRRREPRIPLAPTRRNMLAAVTLALLYLAAPPVFFDDVMASGSHHLDVLVGETGEPGRHLGLDRVGYSPADEGGGSGGRVSVPGGEMRAVGHLPSREATVSLRGRLMSPRTVWVSEYHVHTPYFRTVSSVLGLVLLVAFWMWDSRSAAE